MQGCTHSHMFLGGILAFIHVHVSMNVRGGGVGEEVSINTIVQRKPDCLTSVNHR